MVAKESKGKDGEDGGIWGIGPEKHHLQQHTAWTKESGSDQANMQIIKNIYGKNWQYLSLKPLFWCEKGGFKYKSRHHSKSNRHHIPGHIWEFWGLSILICLRNPFQSSKWKEYENMRESGGRLATTPLLIGSRHLAWTRRSNQFYRLSVLRDYSVSDVFSVFSWKPDGRSV